jgi:hypothetical protein
MNRITAPLSFVFSLTIIFCIATAARAQTEKQKPNAMPVPSRSPRPLTVETPATPAANPADVASIDAIIAAVYDVISGPAGKKRDWNRMRSLFVSSARLIPVGPTPDGGYAPHILSLDEFMASADAFFEKEGFYEREASRQLDQFGQIAHAFSTYESRRAADDIKPFQRGINSIQLMNDGKRWWIVTIFWQGEDSKTPLPEKYLKR